MAKENTGYSDISFFLGANTPGGFYSLFDELYDPAAGWRLYIIKGGPGTGKSTLMKRVAARADREGLYCERIFCSSDPRSLDGVIIPSLRVSVADGTAPHVLEPKYPGVSETILDLGRYRNDDRLRENAGEILRLTDENKKKHAECAGFLNAAASAGKDMMKLAAGALDLEKLESFISHLCERIFGAQSGGKGSVRRRFLSAVTPEGVTVFYGTAEALAERMVVLEDDIGFGAGVITDAVCAYAASAGYTVIKCLCPLSPDAGCDHLLIPELSLGVFTSNRFHPFRYEGVRSVQCARFFSKNELHSHKNRLSFTRKAQNEMVAEAVSRLKDAKRLHDELEAYYIDAMDFDAVSEAAQKLTASIFER